MRMRYINLHFTYLLTFMCRALVYYFSSPRLFVCLAETLRYYVKTAKHIVEILSAPGSIIMFSSEIDPFTSF